MVRGNLKAACGALVAALGATVATPAAIPANPPFVPPPPGKIVSGQVVYLTGDGNYAQWRAVLSKKLLGSGNGHDFYQSYLSIYMLRRGAYRLRYQSPGNGGPLSTVTQAHGAKAWFPVQDLRFIGAGQFMQPGVQQLVVASHEMAADCGEARITILASGPGGSVVPAASIANPCDLGGSIEHTEIGDMLHLSGPYYAPSAAMCCPTKPHATAVLTHYGAKWVEVPNYFKLYVSRFPPI